MILPYIVAISGMVAVTAVAQGVMPVPATFTPQPEVLAARPDLVGFAYLVVVMLTASRFGTWPALTAAALGAAAFAYFFLAPRSSLAVVKPGDQILFLIYLAGSLLAAYCPARAKRRADVAEAGRRAAERLYTDLQESEMKYRGLLESAPDGLVVVDKEGRIRMVNAQTEAMFGYVRSELLGQFVETLVPASLRSRHAEHRCAYAADPRTRAMGAGLDLSGQRKDGSRFPVDISLSPLHAESELLITARIRDITERKRAEDSLNQTTQELQRVMASVSDALWSAETDEHGAWVYRYISPVGERITGRPAEFYLAGPERWLITVYADERDRVAQAIQRIATGQSLREEHEYRIELPDGSTRWVHDSITATRLEHGRLRIDGVMSDISARKAAEAERQARQAAEAACRAKSEFLANMSHELRSPLTTILGFAGLLARDPGLPDSMREDLDLVRRSGEYLYALINQVLDLSTLEAGREKVEETDFDLELLLDDLRDMFISRVNCKGLQLVFSSAPDLPRHIRTAPLKLRQVLINLIDNSLKFTREGCVTVRIEATPLATAAGKCRLSFSVQDTGPGIAQEELKHIFEAFVQTEAGRQARQGTGLGLAICRGFVQLMGGEIGIESEIGKGTTIRFAIPVQVVESAAPPQASAVPRRVLALAPGQPSFRLLVVDDQRETRHLLVRLLGPLGFELKEASNGQEAITLWREWQPHLIWMDLRMPVLDGREATRRIRAEDTRAQPLIIALTASAFEEERADVLETGCDDFMRKPFRESDLFAMLERHLGVRFIYEEAQPIVPQPPEVPSLAALPAGLRTQLAEALLQLDVAGVERAIASVRDHDYRLASILSAWAGNFQYEQILMFLKAADDGQDQEESHASDD